MRNHTFGWLAASFVFSLAGCKSSAPSAAAADGGAAVAPRPSDTPALAVLEGFEGEIDGRFEKADAGPPASVSALLKNGKMRFDLPSRLTEGEEGERFFGPNAYAIFDSAAKKIGIVSDAKKQVVVIDLNKSAERFKAMSRGRPGAKTEAPEKKVVKTGKVETIAGRSCEDWDISSDHREATVCVAHEGISWFSLPAAALPTEHAWALELLDGKHFPLKFVSYAPDGATEDTRFEVTKIDKKSVADSQLEYPPGYAVLDLDQLVQSLVGMRRGLAADVGENTPGSASGAAAGRMPPGLPSSLPGVTPEQMEQIRQRMQQAQQRRPQ